MDTFACTQVNYLSGCRYIFEHNNGSNSWIFGLDNPVASKLHVEKFSKEINNTHIRVSSIEFEIHNLTNTMYFSIEKSGSHVCFEVRSLGNIWTIKNTFEFDVCIGAINKFLNYLY